MTDKITVLQFADLINKDDFIDTIIRFANREEFRIDICVRTEDSNISKPIYPNDCRYHLIKGSGKIQIPFAAWRLSRLLKKWNVDILHAHHFDQMIIGWLATIFYPKTKLVLGRHYSDSLYRMPVGIKQRFFFWLEKKMNRKAARIIVPSVYIKRLLAQRQNVPERKIDIIYYGLNPDKYNSIPDDQVTQVINEFELEGKYVVACFARLHEEKGHRFFVEAIKSTSKRISNLKVLFVGEGPERQHLEKQISENGLENIITITGWRTDAMAIMKAVDIVVQSTLQEAFSQVMCEAMLLGKPLVMTDVSGAEDLIENGVSGLIIEKGSPEAIDSAITTLYFDVKRSIQVGQSAILKVKEKLPLRTIINDYENSYHKTLPA